MKRLLIALAAMLTCGSVAHAATTLGASLALDMTKPLPKLFVYEGAGCDGRKAVANIEGMLNRKVDGVDDFTQFDTTTDSLNALNWALSCWQGSGYQLAEAIPVAFSSGGSVSDAAAGKLDSYYQAVGKALVSHGFANAYIRLGWEMNGGWYPWGNQPGFGAAFAHEAAVLHATPGSHFTIIFNVVSGTNAPSSFMPAKSSGVDMMGDDDYASSWNSGGPTSEPGIWGDCTKGNLGGYWGFASIGNSVCRKAWYGQFPVAFPEVGVGSRGDGHGACTTKGANDCDDPAFLSNLLAYFQSVNAAWMGYWDYNAGDYNSAVSGGQRPGEGQVLIDAFGSASLKAILYQYKTTFAAETAPTFTCVDATGAAACHFHIVQTGVHHWDVVIWASVAHKGVIFSWGGKTTIANLYQPSTGTKAVKGFGAVNTATFDVPADYTGTQVLAIQNVD